MLEQLQKHIQKIAGCSREELPPLAEYVQVVTVQRRQILLSENSYCDKQFFVVNGCLRMVAVDEKGGEQTIQFAIENWWITDIEAFQHSKRSSCAIQAIETSDILFIDKQSSDVLLAAYPVMERYFRLVYQRAYAAALFRIRLLFSLSKEEMYTTFSAHYPEFIQRIPQKILASFLGFTPEYLSELRKKKRS